MGVVHKFFRRLVEPVEVPIAIPEPPEVVKINPGGWVFFLDEDEAEVLWAKPWPYTGAPQDARTNRSDWRIEGQTFVPARRDTRGNWTYRRCVN